MRRLGVIVPCRNEAAVIGRKLRNLALARWPAAGRPHALLVVDDGSEDGTAAAARALLAELFGADGPVRARVLAHDGRPGKAGALNAGLDALGDDVELVVLSDADVILRPDALEQLAAAFDEPRLGMACGSQEFVASLADDGTPRALDGSPTTRAAGRYDEWTAAVRALESRSGRLFSVHGQLLAWRRSLDLRATPGIAADDLDLMCQVRARGLAVRKCAASRFLEVKTPAGPDRGAQELRRARAYVQVIGRCRLPPGAPWLDRLQFAAYRTLPLAAPGLWVLSMAGLLAAGHALGGARGALLGLLVLAIALATPPGRHLLRLLWVIARATRAERAAPLGDRWEMARR